MKRFSGFLSVVICAIIVLSMFGVCTSVSAAEQVTLTFHSNNALAQEESTTKTVVSGGTLGEFYEIPETGDRFIFEGWYYGRDDGAAAVDFSADTFSEDTDIYAHWADTAVTSADGRDSNKSERGAYDDFDLAGVQIKSGPVTNAETGGLRFIASLSNSLLLNLDALSDRTTGENNSRVEYGFIAAKQSAVNDWLAFAGNNVSDYKLGYNGTNVNGVDTTAHTAAYQGIVSNIDCTASDYSDSSITDFEKYDDYRLYTVAITYADAESAGYTGNDLVVRPYLRYYDANGLLRTVYDNYDGSAQYGACVTSYDTVSSRSVSIGYYSSVATMLGDANNLNLNNADSDASGAAGSMYISGGRAYMRLLKNTTLNSSVTLTQKADFNLNGFILSTGSYRVNSQSEFAMYNGTYTVGSTAVAFCAFAGDLTELTNVKFTAENLTENSQGVQFNGVICMGKALYVTDCDFEVSTSTSQMKCFGSVLNSAKYGVFSNSRYSFESAGFLCSGIYALNSAFKADGCSVTINETAEKEENACAYPVVANKCSSAVLSDMTVNVSGNFNEGSGIYVNDSRENASPMGYMDVKNYKADITVSEFSDTDNSDSNTSAFHGMDVRNVEAFLDKTDINISVNNARQAIVRGIWITLNSVVDCKDADIDITSETDNNYSLYGIMLIGDSKLTLRSCDIRVPVALYNENGDMWECNVGVSANGNSVVTIDPENDEDVFVQGGNAALNSSVDAKFFITGGNFCSPTHGGAYFGGDAEITGGKYYTYTVAGHTNEGAFYITHNAVVNISNAQILAPEGLRGLRTRNNSGVSGSPVVNVSNTFIRGANCGVEVSSGTIYLNEGVTIQAAVEYSGNVVDNR